VSTLRRVGLPSGVRAQLVASARGPVATLQVDAERGAPTVLLVPGWTGSKEDFAGLLPELAGHGLRPVALDQRGQLDTPGSPDPAGYTLDALAADVLALAAVLDPRPVHLVGHSFGGLVAGRAAVRGPLDVAGLTLLCSGPGALPSDQHAGLLEIAEALDHGLAHTWDLMRKRDRDAGEPPAPPEVDAWMRHRFLSLSVTAFRAQTEHLVTAPDPTDDLGRRPVPVQVVTGEHDDAWPLPQQQGMAERLSAHYRVLAGCGHSPAVDDPAATAAAIAAHVHAWPAPVPLLDVALPAGPQAVPAARAHVRAALAAAAPAVDDAELVASELVTNAVVHAEPPVRLRLLQRGAGSVDVLVRDSGHTCDQAPSGRPDHGRGLRIVTALAQRRGAWLDPAGCWAWARLAVVPQPDPAAV
jgi:pimeloyl-ACP methyl ester carboxylesterase